MKRAALLICIILVLAVSLLALLSARDALLNNKTVYLGEEDTVAVYGRINFPSYRKGDIGVYWSFKGDKPAIQPVLFKGPGPFSIRVPKNIGKIYLSATSYLPGEDFPIGVSNHLPVEVGAKDLIIDTLEMESSSLPLMLNYRGPTVKIKGRIIANNYSGGLVNVIVHSQDNYNKAKRVSLPPDIAVKTLSKAGRYEIDIPRGIGEIYLQGIYMPGNFGATDGDQPGMIYGECKKNPLIVADTDIDKADIVINIPNK